MVEKVIESVSVQMMCLIVWVLKSSHFAESPDVRKFVANFISHFRNVDIVSPSLKDTLYEDG